MNENNSIENINDYVSNTISNLNYTNNAETPVNNIQPQVYQEPVQYQPASNIEYYQQSQPSQPSQPVEEKVEATKENDLDNKIDYENLSILKLYGEYLTDKKYITNPAIARDDEIKKMTVILLTPEKSALLVGKPGIGKTSIVEGLAYRILNDDVPNKLKGYQIIKINSSSLLGKVKYRGREEMVITILVDELSKMENTILFIDEIHTLIGSKDGGPMDLANILKPAIDRGNIKLIGATTDIEYNTYVVRDRAFLRRFDRVDVIEQDIPTTIEVLMKTLPKTEHQTGIKFKYNEYVTRLLIESIVEATSQFKRVYGLGAMYPDIAFSVLTAAFSNALFDNKEYVEMLDVYNAIKNSKRIYPKTRIKELEAFREKFKDIAKEENIEFPIVQLEEIEDPEEF